MNSILENRTFDNTGEIMEFDQLSVEEEDKGSTESETEEEDTAIDQLSIYGHEEDLNDLNEEDKLLRRTILKNFIANNKHLRDTQASNT